MTKGRSIGLQARQLAKRLGPLADGFPRSIMEAVRMHRVPAELEPDLMCAANWILSLLHDVDPSPPTFTNIFHNGGTSFAVENLHSSRLLQHMIGKHTQYLLRHLPLRICRAVAGLQSPVTALTTAHVVP